MRKFLLIVTAVAGLASLGHVAPAAAQRVVATQGVALADYDGWREREWRRHERWREWHHRQEWLRWHRWHDQGY
jgi:hypothetical protein